MNQRKIERLLRELTPEIRAYLFPGMTLEEPCLEEPSVLGSAIPEPMVRYDLKPEADNEIDSAAASEPIQRKEREPCLRKRIFGGKAKVEASAAEPDAEALDPRTAQILAEIRRLQEKYGVTIDELELMLGYTVNLSPL